MARTIHADLLSAQNALNKDPYIYLPFTSADGLTTYNYSSDQQGGRILFVDHYEEAYGSNATIMLANSDRTVPYLKGYWVEIGYGLETDSGNRYAQTPRLWVKHQQIVSSQGRLVVILELEGMWEKATEMSVRVGDPPYYRDEDGEFISITPYDAIDRVLTEIGMTLNALVEDDSIMDTYVIPVFLINMGPFESGKGLLQRLISQTKSYLKPLTALEWEIKYPQDDDAVDLNYYNDTAPYFYEYTERYNVLIPNHVYVFCNEVDGWDVVGEASDTQEIADYADIVLVTTRAEIDNEADANNQATAKLLFRAKMEATAGRLYGPHDCQVELYDRVKIYDSRNI
jgi:hypothetical protein